MNTVVVSLIVFACVFGGAILGLFLAPALPREHLSPDSKDLVKLGMGLVGTMTAMLLGLSPQNDNQRALRSDALSIALEHLGK